MSLSRSPNKMFPFNHRSSSYLLLVVTILGALSSGGGMKIANSASEVAQSEVLVFETMDGVSATDVMNGAAVEAAWAAAGRARDGGEARPKHQRSRKEMSKKNGRHPWKKNGKNGKNQGRDKNGASELSSTRSDWRTTGVTFYGQTPSDDNGVGITGVDLFKYGKAGIRFKGEVVYPAAVFQGHAATFLYKVLEVTSADFKGTGRVFVHVVDVCNSSQDICRKNVSRYGQFLVDVHETATGLLGVDDGLLKGSFRVVGEIEPSELPKKVWRNEYVLCGCRGSCRRDGEMVWRPLKAC